MPGFFTPPNSMEGRPRSEDRPTDRKQGAEPMGYYVRVEPDVNLFVEDINPKSKKTVLFLHGWPASHRMFEYQFDAFSRAGIRCIGWDMRGFGQSDRPAAGYSYDRLADDVAQVIGALGLSDITLLGHSMGAAVALRYMARHGEKGVARLILCAAAAPSVTQRPGFPYGVPVEVVNGLVEGARANRPQMLRDFGEMFFFRNTTVAFKDWFQWLGLPAAGWATAQCAETFRDETLFADLPKITVPTLLLHGVHDAICLYPLALALQKGIAGSRLVPFESSGHGLFWEEKDKANREILQFIG